MKSAAPVSAFIWDFDGTLFDTYPHTVAAFCETLRRHGRQADEAEVYEKMKITVWEALRHYGADEAFVREFYALENTLSFPPTGRPFEGIPALLRYVTARGGENYLYTHRDRVALEYLDLFGLTPLFSGFVTAENGFPLKPAPDALNWLAQSFALDPARCLMVGDRLIDTQAGKTAGMRTCLLHPDGGLPADQSDFYCRDVPALAALIKKLPEA